MRDFIKALNSRPSRLKTGLETGLESRLEFGLLFTIIPLSSYGWSSKGVQTYTPEGVPVTDREPEPLCHGLAEDLLLGPK